MDEGNLDLSVLKQISGLRNSIGTVKTDNLAPAVGTTFSAVEEIVKSVFDSKQEVKISNTVELSFIKEGGGTNSNTAIATIKIGRVKEREDGERFRASDLHIPIKINMGVQQTRVSRTSLLTRTVLQLGSKETSLWDALTTSKQQNVRLFLTELETNKKFESYDAGSACIEFYNALFDFLTERDAAHYYYAFLQAKGTALARSKEPRLCTEGEVKDRLRARNIEFPKLTADVKSILESLPKLPIAAVPMIGGEILPKGTFPVIETDSVVNR